METCPICGQPATTRMLDGNPLRFEPYTKLPAEYFPMYSLTENGNVQRGGVLMMHVCDEDIAERFQGEEQTKYNAQLRIMESAMSQPCPKCQASSGEACMNLVSRTRTKRWPHDERVRDGFVALVWPDKEKSA